MKPEDNENIPSPPSVKTEIPLPPQRAKPQEVLVQKEFIYLHEGVERRLPSSEDLEQAVLGAMLIDQSCVPEVIDILSREIFHDSRHQAIFTAIDTLHRNNNPVDLLTVTEELKRTKNLLKAGAEYYLIELVQAISSGAHIDFHTHILLQKFVQRELIKDSRKTIVEAFKDETDIFKVMDKIETSIARISNVAVKKRGLADSHDAEDELINKINLVRAGETPGIYTGISEFDEWGGGFMKRELITIASRPGVGKTTCMLSIASRAVFEKNVPVAIFSLEMSSTDLIYRVAARLTGITYSKIRKGTLDDAEKEKVIASIKYIKESKLRIYDTSHHKNVLENIIARTRKLVLEGYREVFVDYVQLMKLYRQSSDRTSDLSTITRELKATANELNIPVIEFAQLNRDVDKRPGHMPVLSDLKQSGSIEEDSDTVIFLLREAYYQQKDGAAAELPKSIIGKRSSSWRKEGIRESVPFEPL